MITKWIAIRWAKTILNAYASGEKLVPGAERVRGLFGKLGAAMRRKHGGNDAR